MKTSFTLIFAFCISVLTAQELDASFGNNGFVTLTMSPSYIDEHDTGLVLVNNSTAMALNHDGSVKELGPDGEIVYPFSGTHNDYISHSLILDDKLMLLGCSRNLATSNIDVFINHYDVDTGEPIEVLNYTQQGTSDREFSAYFSDSDLHLFGYNGVYGQGVFHSIMDESSNKVNEISSYEHIDGSNVPYLPVKFVKLSSGKLLVFYYNLFVASGVDFFYKVVGNIDEAISQNSNEILPYRRNWLKEAGFFEFGENSIVIVKRGFSTQDISFSYSLGLLNLQTDIEEDLELDFLEKGFVINAIEKYDSESFLIMGYMPGDNGEEIMKIYSVNNDFTLNAEFSENGVYNLDNDEISKMSSFKTKSHLYVAARTGAAKTILFRYETKTISVSEESTVHVEIFPNPTSDLLNISGFNIDSSPTYKIHDASGRQLQNGTLESEQVSLTYLESGLMFISLETADTTITRSFVKK